MTADSHLNKRKLSKAAKSPRNQKVLFLFRSCVIFVHVFQSRLDGTAYTEPLETFKLIEL
jgi:hypothetical protein